MIPEINHKADSFPGEPQEFLRMLRENSSPQKKKAEAFSLRYMEGVELLKLGLNDLI